MRTAFLCIGIHQPSDGHPTNPTRSQGLLPVRGVKLFGMKAAIASSTLEQFDEAANAQVVGMLGLEAASGTQPWHVNKSSPVQGNSSCCCLMVSDALVCGCVAAQRLPCCTLLGECFPPNSTRRPLPTFPQAAAEAGGGRRLAGQGQGGRRIPAGRCPAGLQQHLACPRVCECLLQGDWLVGKMVSS